MTQDIKFQGLSNSPSDYDAQDGELGTLLNLINEDGALKPIHQPIVTDSNITIPDGATVELVHKVTHDNTIHSHYIIRRSDDTWCWTEKDGDGTFTDIDLGGFKVNAVTAVGNILNFVGDTNIMYAYWKFSYYYPFSLNVLNYNAVITNVKSIDKFVSANLGDDWNDAFSYVNFRSNAQGITRKGASIIFNAIDAQFNYELEEEGDEYFKYTVFGVLALRLYDGSHFNISNPFILAPELTWNKIVWREETKAVGTTTSFHSHSINVTMELPEQLKDLVIGVDVYLTEPESFIDTSVTPRDISRYENFLFRDDFDKTTTSAIFSFVGDDEIYNIFDNKSYYLCKSIPLEKFGTDITLKRITRTEESLSLADFKRKSYGGQCALTYNNRLHIGNCKQSFIHSYDDGVWFEGTISDTQLFLNEYADYYLIDFYNHSKYVCKAVFDVTISENGFVHHIYYASRLQYPVSPILSYPSTYANEMTLYLYIPKYEAYYKKKVTLKSSNNIGLSYYINISNNRYTKTTRDYRSHASDFGGRDDEKSEEQKSELDDYMYRYHDDKGLPAFMQVYRHKMGRETKQSGTFGETTTTTNYNYYWENDVIKTGDFEIIDKETYDEMLKKVDNSQYITSQKNLVKVSEAENPLVFPAKNSVQVGSSIINALAANTRPISEGQFGEAPLYAFTDEGVWTLMTSSEGTYEARQPANREICTNPKSILQIDDAVLFATERGIMLQNGKDAECITDSLDGYPFDFTQLYKEDFAKKVLAVGNISEEAVKYVRFRDYLQSADMIYDYYDNRIIVFNPAYPYAYVYSLKSKTWSTMANTINKRVNIYPESYGVNKDGKIVDVYVKEPTDSVPYFLCSRPLGLGTPEVFKTMFTAITRGYFRGTEAGKCGMVLYGSNDLFHWYLIKSSVNKYLRGMMGSPYKYFRIALIGSLLPDESITGMSADFQERWQNKLR